MPRIALYARVSTQDQHPEAQLQPLRDYTHARGFEVVAEYVDHGISGAKARRPALDAMMADARRRRFDTIVVVKLDRLGRSLTNPLNLLGELEALGVDFIALDDGMDTATPGGKLFLQIRGAFAEYERSITRERIVAGLHAARRRGAQIGRPKKLSTAREQSRLEALFEGGATLKAIAQELGVAECTVSRQVRRLGFHRGPSRGRSCATGADALPA